MGETFALQNLLEIRSLEVEQIQRLLERARFHKVNRHQRVKTLQDRLVANLFFEPSTRTRFSFEVAAKRLGAQVLNFSENTSSRVKGESVYDTIKTIEAMGVEAAIVRITENMMLNKLEPQVGIKLINAGAGSREHPTQALLDLLTIKEAFGRLEGLTVGIIGDVSHSRVVGSHMHLLPRLGMRLLLGGPEEFLERSGDPIPDQVEKVSVPEIIREADVVMMLRIQHERHEAQLEMSKAEYLNTYGLSMLRGENMKKGAIIMHPAPFNRGVEIDARLVEAPNSVIFKQVENGVYVRMAVLEAMLGGWEV